MTRTRLCFTLYFLLLSVTPAEFSDVVGGGPVQASAGDDVILSCHLEPPFDVRELTVHWTRNDFTVHVYRNRKDDDDLQDQQFRGRTSLFHSELSRGNISLKLGNVTEEDSGLYFCYVPRLESQVKRGNVLLTVQFSDVVGHEPVQASAGEDVVLPCRLGPPIDVNSLTVHWTRNDLTVHIYRHRNDNYDDQDEQFRDRTSLFPDELSRGNISLKLTKVTEKDSGLYVCYVPRLNSTVKTGNVLLRVNPRDQDGGRGGNDEKESGDQTGAIVGSVVGAVIVILLVLLVLGWKHKDRLRTSWDGRWRPQRKKQGEVADPVELDRLNSNPDQNPQGAAAQ